MAPKFTLQPVLDYRHSLVEILEVELGRFLHEQQRCKALIDALQNSQWIILEKLGSCQQGEIDLFMVAQLRSSLNLVKEHLANQRLRLLELAKLVQAKQQELVAARQEEEVLVILKDKEIERYQVDQAQLENRLQDDIYIAQAYRRAANAV